MKKNIIAAIAATTLLASCGTYTGQGAATGAHFGAILGSAIGGINGGYRGSDLGTVIGMAGGAVVGAAIGKAADDRHNRDMQQYSEEKARLQHNREMRQQKANGAYNGTFNGNNGAYNDAYDSGFDATNSADDRIDIDFGTPTTTHNQQPITHNQQATISASALGNNPQPITNNQQPAKLSIRNARFIDANGDGIISRGEKCDIVFEIYNPSHQPIYNIEPAVMETTGNRHLLISPPILIESLAPHKGVKYTARIVADRSLKNGNARFNVAVLSNGQTASNVTEFNIITHK